VAEIVLDRVTKSFRDGTVAVRDLSLEARDGELLVLVGPSGCGKSTILRMVAGLDTPSAGTIKIGGRPVDELTPGARDVAMVFQDYALYPHMTAYKNIAFALKPLRLPRPEVDRRVRSSARVLGIESLLGRRPRALSGGERQRVALGRALVRDPTAFLLDEPLSNLDAKLRVEMRAEIRRLHDELGTTFLYVTHDQIEATTVGDRVAVLRAGEIQQVDDPRRLYRRPSNVFVAAFIGSPGINLVPAKVERRDGAPWASVGPWNIPLPPRAVEDRSDVIVGIRPEAFEDRDYAAPSDAAGRAGRVSVVMVEPLPGMALVHFEIEGKSIHLNDRAQDGPFTVGSPPARIVAAVDARTGARPGGELDLMIDDDSILLFDAVSGVALPES
jgi:multiple sugar transport system ATP-binding protein